MTRPGLARLGNTVRERPALLPRGHGQDFVVWDRAAAATLQGTNIYTHHPAYPGGPYAYLPLFLYVELPMYWLAVHAHLSFTVLGKLPVVAADVACALLVSDAAEASGAGRRAAAVAGAAFFLNPLVLYDSAYYGRFDTVACAFLLLAARALRRPRQAPLRAAAWYGLAIAAKTFPAFVAAGVFRATARARIRAVAVVAAVIAAVALPYLGTVHPLVQDAFAYDFAKEPQGLSWQTLLVPVWDAEDVRLLGTVLLAGFVVGSVWLTRIRRLDSYVPATLLLFLLLSKVVLEQYLVWPLPWLAAAAAGGLLVRRLASGALLAVLTVVGCLDNESFHPLGRSSAWLVAVLVGAVIGYLAVVTRSRDLRAVADQG
jgi:hypothetical protein